MNASTFGTDFSTDLAKNFGKSLMKISVLSAAVTVSASVALAYPSTLKMSCRKAANLVASRGAVVLSTGPHLYDRYVSHQGHCVLGETTRAAFVPTADAPSCFIGYTCAQDNRGGSGGN